MEGISDKGKSGHRQEEQGNPERLEVVYILCHRSSIFVYFFPMQFHESVKEYLYLIDGTHICTALPVKDESDPVDHIYLSSLALALVAVHRSYFGNGYSELPQVFIRNKVVGALIGRKGRVLRGAVEPVEGAQQVIVIPLLRGEFYGLLIRLADEVYGDIAGKGQDEKHDKESAQDFHEPL